MFYKLNINTPIDFLPLEGIEKLHAYTFDSDVQIHGFDKVTALYMAPSYGYFDGVDFASSMAQANKPLNLKVISFSLFDHMFDQVSSAYDSIFSLIPKTCRVNLHLKNGSPSMIKYIDIIYNTYKIHDICIMFCDRQSCVIAKIVQILVLKNMGIHVKIGNFSETQFSIKNVFDIPHDIEHVQNLSDLYQLIPLNHQLQWYWTTFSI